MQKHEFVLHRFEFDMHEGELDSHKVECTLPNVELDVHKDVFDFKSGSFLCKG